MHSFRTKSLKSFVPGKGLPLLAAFFAFKRSREVGNGLLPEPSKTSVMMGSDERLLPSFFLERRWLMVTDRHGSTTVPPPRLRLWESCLASDFL